jgi:hypothetical protein
VNDCIILYHLSNSCEVGIISGRHEVGARYISYAMLYNKELDRCSYRRKTSSS